MFDKSLDTVFESIDRCLIEGEPWRSGKAVALWPWGHGFKSWYQPLAEMQGKAATKRPKWSDPSPDPVQAGATCTGLPFFLDRCLIVTINWCYHCSYFCCPMDYRSFGTAQWLYFQGQVWTGMGEIRRTVWGTIELEKKKCYYTMLLKMHQWSHQVAETGDEGTSKDYVVRCIKG